MRPTFSQIINTCQALSSQLSDVIFIGGVAVYLHSMAKSNSIVVPESSHDADFMISFSDYGILKDHEEITSTPRLSKHQMLLNHVEFDIYVEKINKLVVPYDEVAAHAATLQGISVACLEHLLVLKLEAYTDRRNTSKGDKDRRDIAKIGILLGGKTKYQLIIPHMHEELVRMLADIARSQVFYELCQKNAHMAKKARKAFATVAQKIAELA
jgi:hypothetical protein